MENQLLTIVSLFVFAIVGGIIATRFRQPIVLGLLLVGAIIGPHALNLVHDEGMIHLMIEFGAILLLFVVGLEFSVKKLVGMGAKVFAVGFFKIGLVFVIGYLGAIVLGMDVVTSVLIGIILSFASTVVVVKILEQKELIRRPEVPFVLAVLIIEDIVAVIVLTLLAGAQSTGTSMLATVEQLLISIAILIFAYLVVSRYADRLFASLLKHAHDDLIVFIGLGLCAGFAYLAYALGLSPTAGAFFAGSIVASLKDSKTLGAAVMPHSLMFSSLFFIAIGTLVDFSAVLEHIWLILALLGLFLLASIIAVTVSTSLFANFKGSSPLFSSIAMLSVGEFSLLAAHQAGAFGVTMDLVSITTSLIFFSSVLMSLLIKHTDRVADAMGKMIPHRFTIRFQALSMYISSVLQQLDTESTATRRFKKCTSLAGMTILWSVLLLIGTHKLVQFLLNQGVSQVLSYVLFACAGIILIFLLRLLYVNIKEARALSIQITAHLEQSMNSARARRAISMTSWGFAFITLGMFSPLGVLLLGLPPVFSIAAVIILVIGMLILSRAFITLTRFSSRNVGYVPRYNKYTTRVVLRHDDG